MNYKKMIILNEKVPFVAYCTFKHNTCLDTNICKYNRDLGRDHKL